MSRRAIPRLVTSLACLCILGGGRALSVEGQTYESEESLIQRIQTLGPLVEEALVEAEAAETARVARERQAAERIVALDTLRVGEMTIIAPEPDAARARELFQGAWDQYFEGIRSAALQSTTFTFQARREAVPIFTDTGTYARHITLKWWQNHDDALAVVANAITHSINRDLEHSEVARWAGADPLVAHDPAELYRRLAVTPSRSVRACLAGSAASCSMSLGLVEGASIGEWYTPDERRALAVTGGDPGSMSREARVIPPAVAACLADADPAACDAVLLSDSRRDLTPLRGAVRASLLRHALETGGDGAWGRLVEARDRPVVEALEYTASTELDVVVASWNRSVLAARPEVHASLGSRSFFALMWIVFFAGMAMRSTRWRLG